MNHFLLAVALWVAGGWAGAQIAVFFNRGSKLGFWGRLWAGVLGGVVLGMILKRAPFLEPVTRFFHSGHIEDAVAGVLGGLAVALAGGLLALGKGKSAK
jgi:hypothetical protein